MRGLLGRDGLEQGEGLLLRPASSIHTFFMRFPIDAVFLDREPRRRRHRGQHRSVARGFAARGEGGARASGRRKLAPRARGRRPADARGLAYRLARVPLVSSSFGGVCRAEHAWSSPRTSSGPRQRRPSNGAVVTANEVTRRYGEGDTAVDALRGVTLEVAPAQLTAIMGPSGSGKSTLMHILAALDLPTSGYVTLAGTRLGNLSDTEITKLRRKHIGFIFQFFNLLPMLTAEENILLPLSIAGKSPTRTSSRSCSAASGSRTGARTGRPSSRAASSSASPSRARSSPSRRSSSPTSRPGTSTRRRATRSSSCCTRQSRATTRRWSWSPTTRRRRRSRTASSSSPTDEIVRDLGRADEEHSWRRSRKSP